MLSMRYREKYIWKNGSHLNLLMPVGPLIDKRPDSFCDNLFHKANFRKFF